MIFVSSNGNIAHNSVASFEPRFDPLSKWKKLQLPGAPSGPRRRQKIAVLTEPEIEVSVWIEPFDFRSQKTFETPEKIINLGKFLSGISKEILKFQV
jgi:hypothetical protein